MLGTVHAFFDRHLPALLRELRWSYLPPLMVYLAAGISGLTGIVGTFFIKDYLDLSAAFLAAVSFWAGIPWALKVPMGHLVDLIWRYKAALVVLGASLIAASLLIMIGLITRPSAMASVMPSSWWFVLSALLSPVGYMTQDTVADAMTVEAVPRVDSRGVAIPPAERRRMNTTLQTLGRVAIIGGGVLVSVLNVVLFTGAESLSAAAKMAIYAQIYAYALLIPVVSVLGVAVAAGLRHRQWQRLAAQGLSAAAILNLLDDRGAAATPNWWILGGSVVFLGLTLSIGLSTLVYAQELIFAGSLLVIGTLMWRLLRELEDEARRTLLGTAIVIFVFRAMPGPGAGSTWWMIDELGFDQSFLARLSLVASVLTLVGLFAFRRLMAERSLAYIVGGLTLVSFILGLPTLAMYYGLHVWTAAHTGGIVDARFIALVDTALESPLGQIAMVPLLAWIANSAPAHLKATYFAVMASFTNLALSASQLGTRYLNEIFIVVREMRDPLTHAITTTADYSALGGLMICVLGGGLVLPLLAILGCRVAGLRSA